MITHIRERISAMFSDLSFDSQRHLYFWKGVKVPKSVTGLIERHKEPFDEKKWLPICAKKEGISEHELKHKWQTINQEACQLGSDTHDFMEHFNGLQTPTTPQQKAGVKFFKDIVQEYDIVFRELRMYSRKYNFAGTADLLLRHKVTGEIVIADYKTNKDIFKSFGMLKPPFAYLVCHPYNEYQLQLSYYQLMLQEINVPVSKRILVYLKADETYKIFETVDFTSYIEEYIENKKLVA